MRPRFELGAEVRVLRNVRNDGTFPGLALGAHLIRRGSTGYVCDFGRFLQDQIIYSVHFLAEDRRVGCREEELQPASEPWISTRFEFRDKVTARIALGSGGARPGAAGRGGRGHQGHARHPGRGCLPCGLRGLQHPAGARIRP